MDNLIVAKCENINWATAPDIDPEQTKRFVTFLEALADADDPQKWMTATHGDTRMYNVKISNMLWHGNLEHALLEIHKYMDGEGADFLGWQLHGYNGDAETEEELFCEVVSLFQSNDTFWVFPVKSEITNWRTFLSDCLGDLMDNPGTSVVHQDPRFGIFMMTAFEPDAVLKVVKHFVEHRGLDPTTAFMDLIKVLIKHPRDAVDWIPDMARCWDYLKPFTVLKDKVLRALNLPHVRDYLGCFEDYTPICHVLGHLIDCPLICDHADVAKLRGLSNAHAIRAVFWEGIMLEDEADEDAFRVASWKYIKYVSSRLRGDDPRFENDIDAEPAPQNVEDDVMMTEAPPMDCSFEAEAEPEDDEDEDEDEDEYDDEYDDEEDEDGEPVISIANETVRKVVARRTIYEDEDEDDDDDDSYVPTDELDELDSEDFTSVDTNESSESDVSLDEQTL